MATSAIWNVTYLPCLTTFAPILISFSRSVVSDQCSTSFGSVNVPFGSEAEVQQTRAGCLLLAISGHSAPHLARSAFSQEQTYNLANFMRTLALPAEVEH